MNSHEREALIALAACPYLEPRTLRNLVTGLGSALAVWGADVSVWESVSKLQRTTSIRLHAWRQRTVVSLVEAQLRENHIDCLVQGDKEYPEFLLDLTDAPLVLFLKGNHDLLSKRGVSIVGTRRASGYGIEAARWISETLAASGCTIISGLALGIDGAAHAAALARQGSSIAVMGCGVDICYPQSHQQLYRQLLKVGCVVSEYAPGTPVAKHRFPERNRLIAALSSAVVVIQAGEKSGALRTVDSALELGRDVFAVPGPITSIHFRGSHRLLQQGAGLLVDPMDLLVELGIREVKVESPTVPERWAHIYDCLDEPLSVSQLFRRSNIHETILYAGLLELELAGLIKKSPGGLYERRLP